MEGFKEVEHCVSVLGSVIPSYEKLFEKEEI